MVLYERDFTSALLPWQALEPRGVELRLVLLEKLADAVDERTAVVCVSLVQSADGRVADLDALRATGARICLDATQAVATFPIDLTGVDYLVAHGYKWMLCPRGLGFLYVSPERRDEVGPWTAGWKARVDPYEDYYGCPRCRTRRAASTSRCPGSRRPGHERASSCSSPSGTTALPSTTSPSPAR